MSRIIGPYAAVQASARAHHHELQLSSRLLGQELLTAAPVIATGEFTRRIIWSKTPDAWLAQIQDADGNLLGVEIAFDAEDVFLLLDEHLLPPTAG